LRIGASIAEKHGASICRMVAASREKAQSGRPSAAVRSKALRALLLRKEVGEISSTAMFLSIKKELAFAEYSPVKNDKSLLAAIDKLIGSSGMSDMSLRSDRAHVIDWATCRFTQYVEM
jgi:hypothetical protein